METIELHLRAFMMKLISLDGALGDIDNVEGEHKGRGNAYKISTELCESQILPGRSSLI
jgi:hypothetical protein